MSSLPEIAAGLRLPGGLELVEPIGAGGMGEVWRAHDPVLQRDVAVKVLHEHVAADPKVKRRFHREARMTSRLSHPNTVRVFDFGRTEEGRLYLAMELLDGPDLLELLQEDDPLTPRRIGTILIQVLNALEEAHDEGIVHRDLKPENVMVVEDHQGRERVKVCDFGIAKLVEAEGSAITITGNDYTVASIGDDLWYSHTPVIALTPDAWAQANAAVGGTGEPTVLAVSGTADWTAVAAQTDTVADTTLTSLTALETFRSEIGSLALMIAMLFGVSALVVGAFFTVWTMQRAGDIAVLKALGATTGSLVRDALGQALVVLIAGIGVGIAAVVGFGTLAGQALPFVISPLTTLAPAVVMALLGLAGAAFALRTVTTADPLTALGSNR